MQLVGAYCHDQSPLCCIEQYHHQEILTYVLVRDTRHTLSVNVMVMDMIVLATISFVDICHSSD